MNIFKHNVSVAETVTTVAYIICKGCTDISTKHWYQPTITLLTAAE